MNRSANWLIVLLGPTGVGKTETGIKIAGKLGTEILSADSRQFYREMSLGTAVPSTQQLNRIPHHFIQHLKITDYYSASRFEQDALKKTSSLFRKNPLVLLLGGSMLYIDAVIKGIDDIPDIPASIREHYQKKYEDEGLSGLRRELKARDPEYYETVDLKNYKRILRGLEVTAATGKPYSSFRSRSSPPRPFNILKVGLQRERTELYDRINRRVLMMMEKGLEQEARNLHPYKHYNALNTVGYKELFRYFEGEISREEALRQIQSNTRTFARKQLTWWRKDKKIKWFHPDQKQAILEYIYQETLNHPA